ncbi:unnamed protein product [Blepharisma stoltei]|uniref:Uncharacterized protein n=1 Tax=Blepharisma stoltei TaxID=1481888 RepID=A0AAU9JIU1_9CILI|nr:unnamed protein product [Blepharisma stoltei]
MVGTNIGILIYMVDDITHTDSLETFHHLGQIMIYISSISGLSRSIDLGLTRGIAGLAKNLEYLENNVKALSDLKTTILDDKSRWNYCVSSDIVVKNIIPVWEFERDDFKLQKYNLYDTVSLFIEHVIFIQEKGLLEDARQKDIDYRNHLKWLMINSLSFSYHYIENALSDLVDCETNRVEETSIRINSLLMLGIFILMICLGILLYFIAFLKVHYEKFWNFIKKTVVANYLFIRQASLDRLVSVHGSDLGQDYSFTQKPAATKNFYIKTTLSWKFIWRLSFLGVVSLSFYLLILLYFYKDCEIYMINRPKLLQTLNIRRSLLSQIGFYARDAYRPIAIGYYPNSYSFANSSSEFPSLISYYKTHSYALCESNFKSLISHKLGKNFYESAKYSEYVLDFGIRAAINIFHFDSYYIGNSAFISGKEYSDYISHFMVLQDALADAFDMANTSSKQVISGQLNLIIWVTAIFSAGLVLLYLAYFLPFFEKQTYFLRKMKILPKMILMSEKDFKTKF